MNTIRPMAVADKTAVMEILHRSGFFNRAEISVAEELIDIFLNDPQQNDYRVVVIEGDQQQVAGYLCYGPSPLTRGTYDLYWIAVDPDQQGKGLGRLLVTWLEQKLEATHGRLLIIETSSQTRYEGTRRFYLNMHYRESVRIADFYNRGDDRLIYVKYLEQKGA